MCLNPKLQGGIQERLTFLESRLAEEKDWRKRLEVDLAVAQSSLKKEKQVMHAKQSFSVSKEHFYIVLELFKYAHHC